MSIETEEVSYDPETGKVKTASGYTLPLRLKDGILSFKDTHRRRERERGGQYVYVRLEDVMKEFRSRDQDS